MSCGSISAQLLVLRQGSDTPASVMFLIRESLLGDGCCCSACITSEQEPGNRPRIGETVAKRRISGETPFIPPFLPSPCPLRFQARYRPRRSEPCARQRPRQLDRPPA